jgi:hypothetical protein
LPAAVQSVSHLPAAEQWNPAGQLLGAPGAGSQGVLHAAGGGTWVTHKLSTDLLPQPTVSKTKPRRNARGMAKRYSK